MSWQGKDSQGRAFRTTGATLIKCKDTLISYYRDRAGQYTGMRAVGYATSKDGIDWKQSDSPFFTVHDVKRILPDNLIKTGPVRTRGRIYMNFATVYDEYVYATIRSNVGKDERQLSFIIRGTDPFDASSFEYLETPWLTQSIEFTEFYRIADKWVCLANINERIDSDTVERYTGVSIQDSISEPFKEDFRIDMNRKGARYSRSMIYFQDKYHIIYSHDDDIYLMSETS